MATNLTKKQELFVAEYLVDLNATRAAIAAGYSSSGAAVTGHQLLRNTKISEIIREKTQKKLGYLEITADRVLQEVAKLAFLDPRKFYAEDGSLKRITELDDDTAAALAGINVTELFSDEGAPIGVLKRVKFANKGANLERLMKYLKLYREDSDKAAALSIIVQVNHINAMPSRHVPVISATVARVESSQL